MIKWFASLINGIAVAGAYDASVLFSYQPETPACLMNDEE